MYKLVSPSIYDKGIEKAEAKLRAEKKKLTGSSVFAKQKQSSSPGNKQKNINLNHRACIFRFYIKNNNNNSNSNYPLRASSFLQIKKNRHRT